MKDTRVNIRLPAAEKEQWASVADRYGLTTSEFVIRSVRQTILTLHQQQSGTASTSGSGITLVNWNSSS